MEVKIDHKKLKEKSIFRQLDQLALISAQSLNFRFSLITLDTGALFFFGNNKRLGSEVAIKSLHSKLLKHSNGETCYEELIPEGLQSTLDITASNITGKKGMLITPIKVGENVTAIIFCLGHNEPSKSPEFNIKLDALISQLHLNILALLNLQNLRKLEREETAQNFDQIHELQVFKAVIETSRDAKLIFSQNYLGKESDPIIDFINSSFTKITGYKANETIGKPFDLLKGARTDPKKFNQLIEAVRSGKETSMELLLYGKSGDEMFLHCQVKPVIEDAQRTHRVVMVLQDVGEHHATRQNYSIFRAISREFTKKSTLSQTLREVNKAIAKILKAECCEIWLVDNKEESVRRVAQYMDTNVAADSTKDCQSFVKGRGVPGIVWETGKPLLLNNPTTMYSPFIRKKFVAELGIKAVYGLPLVSHKETIGVLLLMIRVKSLSFNAVLKKKLANVDSYLGEAIYRKRIQTELNSIFDAAPDVLCILNEEGKIEKINPVSEELFGKAPYEMIGKSLVGFIEEDESSNFNSILEQLNNEKIGETYTYECKTDDTENKWLAFTFKRHPRKRILGVIKDVSSLKQTQADLEQSIERFKIAAQVTKDAIWQWTRDGDELIWGEGFNTIFGYPEGTHYSFQDWFEKIHPEDQERVVPKIEKDLQDSSVTFLRNNYRFRRKDGNYCLVEDVSKVIRDEKGEVISAIGAIHDVTVKRAQEEQLKELNKILTQQNKQLTQINEELENFAFIASHDLQEPIRMIIGFLKQLEKKYAAQFDERGLLYLNYAVEGAKRMRKILKGLMEYSLVGHSASDLQDVSMKELVDEVLDIYRISLENYGGKVKLKSDVDRIQTNHTLLFQVISNLVDNAIKFRKPDTPPQIDISVEAMDQTYEFRVRDNGIGVQPQYASRIFTIFQRLHTREQYPGEGIGLSITLKMLERLGGKMHLNTAYTEGTEFVFTLPKQSS